MAARVLKEITTPLARELAEFALIENELLEAHDAWTLWFTKYAGRSEQLTRDEHLISQSLFRDSLILLIGCFDKTAPVRLSASDIYKSRKKGGVSYFEWLRDIRDSYAAHKFGPFRQCVAGVMVDDTGTILGSGRTIRTYAGFVPEAKDDLMSFIQITRQYVEKKIINLARKLTESAEKMSAAELAALKPAETYDVNPHEVRTTRVKFRRSSRSRNDS